MTVLALADVINGLTDRRIARILSLAGWDVRLGVDARDFREGKVKVKILGTRYLYIVKPLERKSSYMA